jgi:site-specific DNA-methyltransferase (adenine-specific)
MTPRYNLHCGDAIAWLETLHPESVDLVVTDPAYESLEKHRAHGTTTRLTNDWFPIFPNARFPELFRQLYRVMKPNTHCYVYCDQETMFVAKPIAEAAGFKFWKGLVWDKKKIGMGYHFRARHEMIVFLEKGKRRLNDLGIPDVIECDRIRNAYPTEKPVAVSTVLIEQSSVEGETVIDPFLGSGSIGEAALRAGRHFYGADIEQRSLDLAGNRLRPLGEWQGLQPFAPVQVSLFGGAA